MTRANLKGSGTSRGIAQAKCKSCERTPPNGIISDESTGYAIVDLRDTSTHYTPTYNPSKKEASTPPAPAPVPFPFLRFFFFLPSPSSSSTFFAIVGGGASGLVLTGRISESVRALRLDAGPGFGFVSSSAAAAGDIATSGCTSSLNPTGSVSEKTKDVLLGGGLNPDEKEKLSSGFFDLTSAAGFGASALVVDWVVGKVNVGAGVEEDEAWSADIDVEIEVEVEVGCTTVGLDLDWSSFENPKS